MTVKAVLFDLGDTILNFGCLDIDDLFAQGARLTYDYLVSHAAAGCRLPGFSHYRRAHIVAIKLHCLWSWLTRREFDCIALLKKGTDHLGFRLNRRQLEHLADLWYYPLAHTAALENDIHATLATLRRQGLQLAIVSNTFIPPTCHEHQLRHLGLRDFFDYCCYSSSSVFQKPDARIYRLALDALRVVPAQAVMVGDKFRYDILGPRRLGIRTIFKVNSLNEKQVPKLPPDTPSIFHLHQLPTLLASWR